MQDLIQAVATHLRDANFEQPVVWENFDAEADLPRYEVRLGPNTNTTRAFSGMSQSEYLVQIDCVVTSGTGLATQIQMIDQIATRFKAGTQLTCGHIPKRPTLGPPIQGEREHRRPITVTVREFA